MSKAKQPQGGAQAIVGYRKPPVHTRFHKGQSGNPGGRPRGVTPGRAAALLEKELFRPIKVKNGNKIETMPVLRVITRKLLALAMSENIAAIRAILSLAQEIDRLAAKQALLEQSQPHDAPVCVFIEGDDRGLL